MKRFAKVVSLLMCLCLIAASAFALAETPAGDAIAADTLVATVNGTEIKYSEVEPWFNSFVNNYGSYYDMSDPEIIRIVRSMSMQNAVNEKLLMQKAAENKLDQLSAEETAQIEQEADADWQAALDGYVSEYGGLTDSSTDEEKAAASAAAVEYYTNNGYSQELVRQWYRDALVMERAQGLLIGDAAVSDAELDARIEELTQADKEIYQNDIAAYEEYKNYVDQMAMYSMYYGSSSNLNPPMYKPAGYRTVKHILLSVDEALLDKLTDLQARLEEQMNNEAAKAEGSDTETTGAEPAPEQTAEPVTQADIDNATAEILASVADTIDEIDQKLAAGEDFDALIEQYGTDLGMTNEPGKSAGYEVALVSSNYVPEFVSGSFSVDNVGDVSAPVVSRFGVHIIKYTGDVAEGPIALTEAEREAVRAGMLDEVKSAMYNAGLEKWMSEADIVYTGVIPSMEQLEAEEVAKGETPAEDTPAE